VSGVEIALTLLVAGLAALDATPVGQTLVSQPLVTAAALGAVWGDMGTALAVGAVLQVLAASTLPVGARTPEDYASGGVVGAALALALAAREPFPMARDAAALLGCLGGMVAATLGVPIVKWQRRRNEGLARWAEAALRAGDAGALASAHRAAVVLAFAAGVTYAAVSLAVLLPATAPLVGGASLKLSRAWALAQPLWIGLGLAQLLHAFVQRRLTRAAVFAAALLVGWLTRIVGMP